MIPAAFDYARASSLDDAVEKLASGGKLVAGGHSLIPMMKFRLTEPERLIDIARVPELSGIRENGGALQIGAGTVHHDVASSALLQQQCPAIAEAAAVIGDPQVRNRGTVGGSIAHADPSADYPAVLLALDAEVHVKGPKGWRKIKASDFFKDLFTVDLAADEIIANVQFAPARASAYAKLHQRASHFAIVGVAAALTVSGGKIQSARVGLTGAGPSATRLKKVEDALAGKAATKESIAAAVDKADADVRVVNADLHASEAYRRAMIPVFARRALEAALKRA